jgi:hypothetical protein
MKDKRYKRLADTFESRRMFSLPFDEYRDEIQTLHKSRKLHKLKGVGDPNFGKHLIEAAIGDQSKRHRYVEILTIVKDANSSLYKMLDSFESYYLIKHADRLRAIRTKDERKQFIRSVLNKFHKYLTETEQLIDILNIYIEDIDKAGYLVTNLVRAYETISKRDPHMSSI